MITHRTNLSHCIGIDSCVYPKMNIRMSSLTNLDSTITFHYLFETKVIVEGNNGERYYVPVIAQYSSDRSDLGYFHERFTEKCETVRDHFITTEGKDVTIEEYKKLRKIELI